MVGVVAAREARSPSVGEQLLDRRRDEDALRPKVEGSVVGGVEARADFVAERADVVRASRSSLSIS